MNKIDNKCNVTKNVPKMALERLCDNFHTYVSKRIKFYVRKNCLYVALFLFKSIFI